MKGGGDAIVEPEGAGVTEGFEVAFLPWLGLQQTVTVGPVTFSPFEPGSVAEPSIRDYLSRYFPRYVEVDGEPVRVIVVARHTGVTGFRYHTQPERLDLMRAASALSFSGIAEALTVRIVHHNEVPVPSADAFQLLFQRFTAGSKFVEVVAGRTRYHWPVDEVMFTRPWAASPVFGDADQRSLDAFGTLLVRPGAFDPDFVERVWRSLEWFRLAHLDGADQTDEAKAVAAATAFESLFGLQENDKQVEFAKRVETLVCDPEMDRDVRVRPKGKKLQLSLAGCWAWDFYELRSRLVHGDAVPAHALNSTSGTSHLVVADLVLRECLLRELFQCGCFGADLRNAATMLGRALAGIPEGPEPFDALEWVVDWHLKFQKIHGELGWSKSRLSHNCSNMGA